MIFRHSTQRRTRTSQSGNIFALLFGAVALTGVLAAVSMQTITGPIQTATKVTQKNLIENALLNNAKLIVQNANSLPSNGDADADSFIEPAGYIPNGTSGCVITFTGGGCIPSTFGATITDPYGMPYGYCVWDHGAVDAGHADGSPSAPYRLNGSLSTTDPLILLVSAGPDRTFQTSCLAYDGSGSDGPQLTTGSDDLVFQYSYAEAAGAVSGLWSIDPTDSTKALIAKNLGITGIMGVGVNDPLDTLHIANLNGFGGTGEELTSGLFIHDPTVVASNITGGRLYYDDRSGKNMFKMSVYTNGTETGMFSINRANGYAAFNTDNPQAQVHIAAGGRFWGNKTFFLQSSDDNDSGWLLQPDDKSSTPTILRFGYMVDNGPPAFTPLTLTEAGRVGINQVAPVSSLDIANRIWFDQGAGNATIGPDIHIASSGLIAAESILTLSIDSNNNSTSDYFDIRKDASTNAGTLLMRLTEAGILTVYGSGTTCTIGNGTGGTSCTSDQRLKKDIKTFDSPFDYLEHTRGVRYKWNEMANKEHKGEMIGVIAQEVQAVLPELVLEDEETGHLSVTLDGFVPILIEAVKELKAENNVLKAKQDELEKRITQIESSLQNN